MFDSMGIVCEVLVFFGVCVVEVEVWIADVEEVVETGGSLGFVIG